MFRFSPFQPGKRRQLWLLMSVSALIVLLLSAAVPAPAQGIVVADDTAPTAEEGTYPTDEEVNAKLSPKILKEVRSGDQTTVTIEIAAGSDTFITSGQPNTNWANDPNMRVGFNTLNNLGAERSFLFFPLNSIPANATLQAVTLRLFVSGFSPTGDSPMPIQARFLNSSWDPNTLTWNSHNPAWGATIGVGNVSAQTGWVEANALAPVNEWYTGARQNFGIMLQGDETPQQRERVFTTLNANNGNWPRLVVTYVVGNPDTTPPVATVNALPQFSPGSFQVTWSGTDNQSGIKWYDVQYQINNGGWIDWRAQVTQTSGTFNIGQNGQLVGFRARAVDNAGNVQSWSNTAQAATTVDTQPPQASVSALPQFSPVNFTVTWSGTDNLSGVKNYDVQFSVNGGPWTNWQVGVQAGSAVFPSTPGIQYGFRARATDNVGNVMPYTSVAQASTTTSSQPSTAHIVPFWPAISNSLTFPVSWAGTPAPGATITSYDVQYRINGGPWIMWQSGIAATTANFTAPNQASYEFQVRAHDNQNQVGPWSAGATMTVDTTAPFITPKVYMPFIIGSPAD